MIGILIVAHGTFGESLIHCASHVMGSRPPLLTQIGVSIHDDPQQVLPQAIKVVRGLDQGSGVLVLSDVYGATPSNIAARLLIPGKVEGVAGVNLPMLVRALTYRNEPLRTVIAKAISGGVEGVMQIPMSQVRNAATGN
jgi:PTS system ascorbate-specific IIA component